METSITSTANVSSPLEDANCEEVQHKELFNACVVGDENQIRIILEDRLSCGVSNLNDLCNDKGETMLAVCVSNNNLECLKFIINSGADINCRNSNGDSVLHVAVMAELGDTLAVLVKMENIDINGPNNKGCSPTYVAARDGKFKMLNIMLDCPDVQFDKTENNLWSPVAAAAIAGHFSCLELLIQRGAELNSVNKSGRSAVYHAAAAGHLDCLDLLLAAGADMNLRSCTGYTALIAAAHRGEKVTMERLLEMGADNTLVTNQGYTATFAAVAAGKISCLEILHRYGGDLSQCNQDNRSPAVTACCRNKLRCLAYLLDNGIDINEVDPDGKSLAYNAAETGNADIFEFLLFRGIDVNSCIVCYCPKEHELLPAHSKNKNRICNICRKNYICTKACLQCLKCDYDVCTACVADKKPSSTLVHAAAMDKSGKCLQHLVDNKVDLQSYDHLGNSPLFYAVEYSNASNFIFLLKNGLSIVHANRMYQRALDTCSHECMVALLEYINKKELPLHILTDWNNCFWFHLLKTGEDYPTIQSVVAKYLELYSDKLSHAVDSQGHSTMNVVSKPNRQILQGYIYYCGRFEINPGPPVHRSATSLVILAKDHGLNSHYERLYEMCGSMDEKSFMRTIEQIGELLDMSYCWAAVQTSFLSSIQSNEEQCAADHVIKISELWCNHEFEEWCDMSDGNEMSVGAFVRFCNYVFGECRNVAIKLMAYADQYEREVKTRNVSAFDSNYVVGLINDAPDKEVFAQENSKLKLESRLDSYGYAIIMHAADRSLDAIFRQERPNGLQVQLLMKEVALAVEHIHSKGVIHGDLKMLNILRVNNKMSLVDMDAAAAIGEFCGCKFSSAVLPPEFFYQFKNEFEVAAYHRYWQIEKDKNSELWRKVKPVEAPGIGFKVKRATFCVKTFRSISSEAGGEQADKLIVTDEVANKELPYELVKADETMDVWSFGLMLYTLCSGKSLLVTNRDDDLADASAFRQAASWTDEQLISVLHNTITDASHPQAIDLLSHILKVSPASRMSTMTEVLNHPYFCGGDGDLVNCKLNAIIMNQENQSKLLTCIEEKTTIIENMSYKTYAQLKKTEEVLLKGIFEATEVLVPTCFVILNQKIEEDAEEETRVEKADRWLDKICSMSSAIAESVSNPSAFVYDHVMDNLLSEDTLYFYLVDEHTMQPVVGDGYPIELSKFHQADILPKVLPLFQLSMKALVVLNGAAGMVKMCGYPVPCIDGAVMDKGMSLVEDLNKKSSVEEYDMLSSVLESSDSTSTEQQVQSVRGGPLRELKRFFREHDPDSLFANMVRVYSNTGISCWTTEEGQEHLMQEQIDEEPTSVCRSSKDELLILELRRQVATLTGQLENQVPTQVHSADNGKGDSSECHQPAAATTTIDSEPMNSCDIRRLLLEHQDVMKNEMQRQGCLFEEGISTVLSSQQELLRVSQKREGGIFNWFGAKGQSTARDARIYPTSK